MKSTHQKLSKASLLLSLTVLTTALSVGEVPLGHQDFVPTTEHPIGFRGDGSGHFPGATPPVSFSEKEGKNVRWSIKLPSWSQSTPLVIGKRVITSAEPDTTLCVDADTGKVLWQDSLGEFEKDWNKTGGHVFLWWGFGYSWPCSDGAMVYKLWGSGQKGAYVLVCYDLESGKRQWRVKFDNKTPNQPDGSGYGSPQLFGDIVFYTSGARAVVALDKKSGAVRWVSKPNVAGQSGVDANAIVVRIGSRQVLVTNIGTVLDPNTGEVLGDAIPSIEKDGKTYSRLWGMVEKGFGKVHGISPITDGSGTGLVAFGPDWPLRGGTEPWDKATSTSEKIGKEEENPLAYCYFAARLGFNAEGKLTSTPVFPDRAVIPKMEYGNGHLTIVKNHLIVMPGYGHTLAGIALETGKLVIPPKGLWNSPKWVKPDPNAPEIKAGMDEFGLTINAVTEPNRGIGRGGYTSYSRTFVDSTGCIWYMNRQAQIYRIDPAKDFNAELAGTLVHPECWTSTASPVPHGNRIYVRTFGRLACIGAKE